MGAGPDVLVAGYGSREAAKQDFNALLKVIEEKRIKVEGVVLVDKEVDGQVHVRESGDHVTRKVAGAGAGVGLVLGLFAPPLLAATAVGAVVGAVAGKAGHALLKEGVKKHSEEALLAGMSALIAVYDHAHTEDVEAVVKGAIKKVVVEADAKSARALKAALADAEGSLQATGTPVEGLSRALNLVFPLRSEDRSDPVREAVAAGWDQLVDASEAVGTVHDARFVALDSTRLAFIATYDGDLETYATDLTKRLGPVLDAILEHVKDPPPTPVEQNPKPFVEWVAAHQLPVVHALYSAYPKLSVQDIRTLRARVTTG